MIFNCTTNADFYLVRLSDTKIVKGVLAKDIKEATLILRWYGENVQPNSMTTRLLPAAHCASLDWAKVNPRQKFTKPCYQLSESQIVQAGMYIKS